MEQYFSYNNNIRYDSIYKYDNDGNKHLHSNIVNQFNILGKIKYKETYDCKGIIIETIDFVYDDNGNIQEKCISNPSSGKKEIISYNTEYNKNGQVVQRDEYINGSFENSQVYSYQISNSSGFSITNNSANGSKTIKEFITDNHGHIINEMHYSNNQLILAFVFEYQYY